MNRETDEVIAAARHEIRKRDAEIERLQKQCAIYKGIADQTWEKQTEIERLRGALNSERAAIAAEAQRYAGHYPPFSDGRNTFILLAEWIERRALEQNGTPK